MGLELYRTNEVLGYIINDCLYPVSLSILEDQHTLTIIIFISISICIMNLNMLPEKWRFFHVSVDLFSFDTIFLAINILGRFLHSLTYNLHVSNNTFSSFNNEFLGSFHASSWIPLSILTFHLMHLLKMLKNSIARYFFNELNWNGYLFYEYLLVVQEVIDNSAFNTNSYHCWFTLINASIHKLKRHLEVRSSLYTLWQVDKNIL